jgi:signal transduction histidine kinase
MSVQPGAILVVDDNATNLMILSKQLEMEGYTVTTAGLGREALSLLRSQPFDVVLLDLMMPEMDGFQVLEQIKNDSALRHIPVIVISALDDTEFVVRSIKMGATDHLPKPFNLFLLRARVNASLAAKRMHDQEAEYLRHVNLLTSAAADMEAGTFDAAVLAPVAGRNDALGQLARVFQHMVGEILLRERNLKQQSLFKSALIGKITHELRSPFVAAGFSVQLLQRYAEHAMLDEMRQQTKLLERQLAEGRQMIDHIISFASRAGKQAEPHLQDTDIGQLIQDTIAPLKRLAAARSVALSSNPGVALPPVRVDRQLIAEAIHHLVLNAIRFNRSGGSVQLDCRPSEGQLVLTVEDTGQGIAADKLDVIWEAFAQAADDTARGVEGLGLGLALVQSVVAAHGGAVFARSMPGQGSTFGFRIPIAR